MSVVNVLMLKALWFQKRSEVFAWHFFQILLFIDPASTSIEPFKLLLCLNNLSCFERRLFLAILKLSPLASLAFRCFCDGFFFTGLPSSILASFSRDVLAVATMLCVVPFFVRNPRRFVFSQGLFWSERSIRYDAEFAMAESCRRKKTTQTFYRYFPATPSSRGTKTLHSLQQIRWMSLFWCFFLRGSNHHAGQHRCMGVFFLKGGEGKSSCLIAVENFNNNNNMFSNKLCCYCVVSISCIIYMYISI